MLKTAGQWHCSNPDSDCDCDVQAEAVGEVGGGHRRCKCGAPMKKKYVPPTLSYLEFLRVDEPLVPGDSSQRE